MRNITKVVNFNTFKIDHLVRSFSGAPLGRAIMFNESMYTPGMDVINVSVLRVPFGCGVTGIKGFQCYVDGVLYKVPSDLNDIHIVTKKDSYIVTNVCLRKIDNDKM